ncbi:MAG: DUF4270 family protein [Owenweeksia sp.]|nr:DUF4270 family protein [Owenweeksia sp.]
MKCLAASHFYFNFKPQLGQTISLPNSRVPRPNSLAMTSGELTLPTLEVPLDPAFFQQNFADKGDGNFAPFSSQDNFIDYFKGIYVTTTNTDGAILYFDLTRCQLHHEGCIITMTMRIA